MNFVYEDISKEDYEKFGIGALKAKYQSPNFDMWAVNESKDVYALLVKDTTFMDDPDFGTGFYVMNIQGLWVDFEIEFIDSDGVYGGETWVKYGVKGIAPFSWDSDGKKQSLPITKLPISYETLTSLFYEAVTARSRWMSHKSTKHEVFFENRTISGV